MSKIFLDHSFRCLKLKTLSYTPDAIIDSMCSDPDSADTKRLLNKISSAIIDNKLYSTRSGYGPVIPNSDGLLPHNSRLYSHGTNTSDIPDIKLIRDLIELKLKIDTVDNDEVNTNTDSEKLSTGHFRFYLPPVLAPQILILIKNPDPDSNRLVLLFHGNVKLLPVFTSYIQSKFDCTVEDIRIDNTFMDLLLNWSIMNDVFDSINTLELWFGKLKTGGKLGSIIIKVESKDIKTLKKITLEEANNNRGFMGLLLEQLRKETSISFHKLSLVKLKCDLYTIDTDGKLKMFRTMTHLGESDRKQRNDQRLSIWWIIHRLSKL